eukprot:gene5983-4290_t
MKKKTTQFWPTSKGGKYPIQGTAPGSQKHNNNDRTFNAHQTASSVICMCLGIK